MHPIVPPRDTTAERLDALTGAFPVVVFELDPDGVFLSEAGAGRDRIVHRYPDSTDAPVGLSAFELYADAPQVIANLRRALRGEAFTGRVDVPPSLGRPASIFEVVYSPVLRPDGRLERLVGVALDVTEREATARQTVRDAERLRRLALRLQTEREAERTRVARTVHDAVGQALTAIRFDAAHLLRALDTDRAIDRAALADRLREVIGLVDHSLDVVGDLAAELRPPVLDALGLSAALADTAARFESRTGNTCALDGPLPITDQEAVGVARATTAFRIVQEALANVARHAGPCSVSLRLAVVDSTADVHADVPGSRAERGGHAVSGRALLIEVRDDGCGLPDGAAQISTPGLAGMAERAAQWGGTLFVGLPDRGVGTVVRALVPLGPEPADP